MAGIAIAKGSKKKKFLQLTTVGRRWKDVVAFRDDLFSRVGDQLFYIQNKRDLLYAILMQISPVNRRLQRDESSIERACAKVMAHFGFKKVKVRIVGSIDSDLPKPEKPSSEEFLQSILQLERLPYQEYSLLSDYVNADLHQMNELISWYEGDPCIMKFITTAEVPRGLEERTMFDFYQRCMKERGEIVKYQLYSLKKRVLAKVQPYSKLLSFVTFDARWDRPYKFARPGAESYFDCRKIDLAKHRLAEFYLDEVDDMVSLYESNKTRFYRVYFKRIPWKRAFDDCIMHLGYLPASQDRVPIFKELLSLFKSKRWMAFYALGLPQVEGIFSEMCRIIDPSFNLNHGGLSRKVGLVRPHYQAYDDNLDYYQYHIPFQRNRFAHTGFDDDFQLKSYDLLIDLAHLLTVFSELNNPLVKVKRLHSKPNTQDFSSIEQFSEYFSLLSALKKLQCESIATDIKKFELFLVNSTRMLLVATEVTQSLDDALAKFAELVKEQFRRSDMEFDLLKSNQAHIKKLSTMEEGRSLLNRIFCYPNDELELLMNYFRFAQGFVKWVQSANAQVVEDMRALNAKHEKRFISLRWIIEHAQKLGDD